MIANVFNFKQLTRIFFKDKFFSILNIIGLSLGITISLILALIISYDVNYDKHYIKYKNIYRLGASIRSTGVDHQSSRSAQELTAIIREEYPEIKAVTSLNRSSLSLVQIEGAGFQKDRSFREAVFQTDSAYFCIFDHEFLFGDPYNCFRENKGVVLTESKARSYFGDRNPLGEMLLINTEPKIITGVIKDLPGNTHLKFSILSAGLEDRGWELENEAYWTPNVYTYVLLSEEFNPKSFIDRFDYIYTKYLKGYGDKIEGRYTPTLERLDKIHFGSMSERDEPRGNFFNLIIIAAIGGAILILSIINYTNLATVKSFSRANEIAIRKVFGSKRRTLAISVLLESVFYSFVALLFSFGVVQIIIRTSSFDQITERHFDAGLLNNPMMATIGVAVALATGILAGLYPSLHISNINVSQILKGKFKNASSSQTFKRFLIIVQFCLSIIVVIFMLVMNQQIDYLKNKDLGFDMDNIIVVPFYGPNTGNAIKTFKADILQRRGILSAGVGQSPGSAVGAMPFLLETEAGMQSHDIKVLPIGDDYLKTMGIKLLDGKGFPPESDVDDETLFLVNEATVKLMDWGDDVLGKRIKFLYSENTGTVTGVVKDFNFESLFTRVEPLVLVKSNDRGYLHLKVESENVNNTLDLIGDRWSSYRFAFPFEYYFMDEFYNRQYVPHDRQYRVISVLSSLCVFVSFLGALGLSAFSAVQRKREMAIRRVVGASNTGVTLLLYKEITWIVIISSFITLPTAYFVLKQWLNNFAYPVEIDLRLFALVVSCALFLTFCVVVFNAVKICGERPAEILKSE